MRDAFAQFDTDGDGRLSRKEIEKAMGNMLSEADLDDLLTDLDGDGDGDGPFEEGQPHVAPVRNLASNRDRCCFTTFALSGSFATFSFSQASNSS